MIRDTFSNALVETDVAELQKYRKEKKRDKELIQMKNEIESLKICINNLCKTVKKLEDRH